MSARLATHIPPALAQSPFEWSLAFLLLLSSLPQAFGAAPPPGSIARLLPPLAQIAWGVALAAGSALVLLGLAMAVPSGNVTLVLRGRVVERLGLIGLGWSIGLYALALVLVAGWQGVTSAALCLALTGSCAVRIIVLGQSKRLLFSWRRPEGQGDGDA